MTGGHGSVSLVWVVHGSSVLRGSRRGVPQSHTWQQPRVLLLPGTVRINRLHNASEKGTGIFSLMEEHQQLLWAWTAVAIFMESRMKDFGS